mmetsp:Transcript_7519/g.10187  ORF Transcript_7519/g.10187 Transcript_7519/m.10187 type:complete len:534 (-) Transcript_7519:232-1833(-)|eukprot:CAMPEP_0185734288 /NCGR_PEP_ID=MMETSP1171-20130828/22036_1 /TAXON_ID=374046 /ORGANISM="Helicotheca tamensis, Strain CCMP826" /LENGTH=533 /DNA_ID=CAMNT_0028404247 /DNA_START=139 /DNA_END=1740 /DNA_ORIENTATION=-
MTAKHPLLRGMAILAILATLSASAVANSTPDTIASASSAAFKPHHRIHPKKKKNLESLTPLDLSSSSSPSSSLATRGGSSSSPTISKEVGGAIYFIVFDVLLRKLFKAKGIAFPSMLAGSGLLFAGMVLVDVARPGWGDAAFDLLNPGAVLLAKWLPVMFVPGLALLPLAPSVGSAMEIVKCGLVLVLGFFFSLLSATYASLGIRYAQGAIEPASEEEEKPADTAAAPAAAPANPYTEKMLKFLSTGFVISAAISLGATMTDHSLATPLQTIFFSFTTFGAFVWGARLPKSFTKVVHPIVTSTIGILLVARLTGAITGTDYLDILRSYKAGSLSPMNTGAGDILIFLLGPSVVSMATAMYSRKKLMAENLLVVLGTILVSSLGGLFGTAAFARLINLGGKAGKVLRLSTVSRNVTTALAIVMTEILGGDISIASCMVVLTGIIGGSFGRQVLDKFGVKDPISRGLGIGSSSIGLGVASLISEQDAFPFAATSMALVAALSTSLVSLPAVANAVIKVAGGEDVVQAATEAATGE